MQEAVRADYASHDFPVEHVNLNTVCRLKCCCSSRVIDPSPTRAEQDQEPSETMDKGTEGEGRCVSLTPTRDSFWVCEAFQRSAERRLCWTTE